MAMTYHYFIEIVSSAVLITAGGLLGHGFWVLVQVLQVLYYAVGGMISATLDHDVEVILRTK